MYEEEFRGHKDVNGLCWFQNSNVKPNQLEFAVWDDKRIIGSHRKGSKHTIDGSIITPMQIKCLQELVILLGQRMHLRKKIKRSD
jgi:hypothetical protein